MDSPPETEPAAWYIDAWCPADGRAFASRRKRAAIDAEETIFLAPPYFEPERVGSLATALAATRGHFQAGFYDRETEIAFPSLAQVVEAVRRGYLAGGTDTTPPGATPTLPVRPVREPPGGVRPGSLVTEEMMEAWRAQLRGLLSGRNPDRAALEEELDRLIELGGGAHAKHGPGLLCKFALMTIAAPLMALAEHDNAPEQLVQTLLAGAAVLRRIGFALALEGDEVVVTVGSGHGYGGALFSRTTYAIGWLN